VGGDAPVGQQLRGGRIAGSGKAVEAQDRIRVADIDGEEHKEEVVGCRLLTEKQNTAVQDNGAQLRVGEGLRRGRVELPVVAVDQQEALGVQSGRRASIAGSAVAGFDANPLAVDPRGVSSYVAVRPIVGAAPASDQERISSSRATRMAAARDSRRRGCDGSGSSRRIDVAMPSSSAGNAVWLRLIPMPTIA